MQRSAACELLAGVMRLSDFAKSEGCDRSTIIVATVTMNFVPLYPQGKILAPEFDLGIFISEAQALYPNSNARYNCFK